MGIGKARNNYRVGGTKMSKPFQLSPSMVGPGGGFQVLTPGFGGGKTKEGGGKKVHGAPELGVIKGRFRTVPPMSTMHKKGKQPRDQLHKKEKLLAI